MKLRLLPGLFLLGLIFVIMMPLRAQQQKPTKHALVIAIGEYETWGPLSSLNDVPFITGVLKKQQFEEKNITVLTNKNATLEGIKKSFESLISTVKKDDIVFIHFSTHGEQLEDDDNKDEIDGYDESIVTYDAVHPSKAKDYASAEGKYFRDDQFGIYMDRLRIKLGPKGDVVVFLDACHSGSGTRGRQKIRGGAPPLQSKGYNPNKAGKAKSADVFLQGPAPGTDANSLATYEVISASRAEETNSEMVNDTLPMGSLSYAISKVLANPKAGTTYRSLFSEILAVMSEVANTQHPVLEGTGLDRELFGGNFVKQEAYIEVEEIDGMTIKLKGGIFSGLDNGAKVAIYPSGPVDREKTAPTAVGIISNATPFSSSVVLEKKLQDERPAAYWVYVTNPVYKIKPLVVGIDSKRKNNNGKVFSEAEVKDLRKILSEIGNVQLDGIPELQIVRGDVFDTLKIDANGYVFATLKKNDKADIEDKIKLYARYKFLLGLEINDPQYNVKVRLIPFVNGKADTSLYEGKIINGIPEYKNGDSMRIEVTNNGDMGVYINILDMQPDGKINAILPKSARGIKSEDLRINAGATRLFSTYNIVIRPPYGKEVFKIFVSETEINLENLATKPGELVVKRGGKFNVIEKLVNDSHNITKRGGNDETEKADGASFNLIFDIKE